MNINATSSTNGDAIGIPKKIAKILVQIKGEHILEDQYQVAGAIVLDQP
jgi:hypothetical protein